MCIVFVVFVYPSPGILFCILHWWDFFGGGGVKGVGREGGGVLCIYISLLSLFGVGCVACIIGLDWSIISIIISIFSIEDHGKEVWHQNIL